MAVRYRVKAFGEPRGPWRYRQRQAEQDAVAAGVAQYDEWGQLYLDGPAEIEWEREPEVRLRA